MFQTIFDKFADWLLPMIIGLLAWYGLHYAVFTPRIMMVDQKPHYINFNADKALPFEVEKCVKESFTPLTLEVAGLEAALFTASFKYIHQPFKSKFEEFHQQLDKLCGVSTAMEEVTKKRNQIIQQQQLQQNMDFIMKFLKGLAI